MKYASHFQWKWGFRKLTGRACACIRNTFYIWKALSPSHYPDLQLNFSSVSHTHIALNVWIATLLIWQLHFEGVLSNTKNSGSSIVLNVYKHWGEKSCNVTMKVKTRTKKTWASRHNKFNHVFASKYYVKQTEKQNNWFANYSPKCFYQRALEIPFCGLKSSLLNMEQNVTSFTG